MKVYLLFKQTYINWEYGYETELVSVYKNREDAEKMRDKLYNTSANNYYVEEWTVE